MSHFVDTNVFLRVLINDDALKHDRSLSLFEAAERGEARLTTSETVIAEIIFVLSSRSYRIAREEISRTVRLLVENRGLTVEHKQSVLDSLDLYAETNLDFEDCLSVGHVRRADLEGIYSYDRDFDRVLVGRRSEP